MTSVDGECFEACVSEVDSGSIVVLMKGQLDEDERRMDGCVPLSVNSGCGTV